MVADILLLETKTTDCTKNVWLPIYCFRKQRRLIGHNTRFTLILGAGTLGGIELAQNGFEPVAQVAQC